MSNHLTRGSILDGLEFSETGSENLKISAGLMRAVEKYIIDHKLTQSVAAKLMGVYQPRISDLLHGKIEKFTIDMLSKAHVSVSLIVDDRLAA